MSDFTECAAPVPGTPGTRPACILGRGHLGAHMTEHGREWTSGGGGDRDGRIVARRVARYHIGDPDWADLIINAYLNPDTHQRQLEQEMKDDD